MAREEESSRRKLTSSSVLGGFEEVWSLESQSVSSQFSTGEMSVCDASRRDKAELLWILSHPESASFEKATTEAGWDQFRRQPPETTHRQTSSLALG